MKLLKASIDGQARYYCERGGRLIDLGVDGVDGYDDFWGQLEQADYALHRVSDTRLDMSPAQGIDWQPLPFIRAAAKVFCVGLNFHDHAKEAQIPVPEKPAIFMRFQESFVGPDSNIVVPVESPQLDFEGELAVVIGRPGRRISADRAQQHVLGYVCLSDNAVRDWQFHSRQATAGKNFPSTGAVGSVCTVLESDPADLALDIVTRLNGEVVQQGSTRDFIFSIGEVINYVSTFTELHSGDIIALGTPAGVGMSREPKLWLSHGDVLEVEIPGVGVLRNPIVAEDQPLLANSGEQANG